MEGRPVWELNAAPDQAIVEAEKKSQAAVAAAVASPKVGGSQGSMSQVGGQSHSAPGFGADSDSDSDDEGPVPPPSPSPARRQQPQQQQQPPRQQQRRQPPSLAASLSLQSATSSVPSIEESMPVISIYGSLL